MVGEEHNVIPCGDLPLHLLHLVQSDDERALVVHLKRNEDACDTSERDGGVTNGREVGCDTWETRGVRTLTIPSAKSHPRR